MGRGRAKAKQTKVARKLKYSTGHTDLSQLAEELGAASPPGTDDRVDDADETAEPARDDDEFTAKYADYADDGDGARRR